MTETMRFNPEDYVLARVGSYPSLYASPTFEQAKLRVYDQLFNVVGNGVRDSDERINELIRYPFDRERSLKFVNGARVMYGYFQTRDYGSGVVLPEGDSITVGDFEMDQYPDVIYWSDAGYCRWNPYPNFNNQYSIVCYPNFRHIVGEEWAAEVVWYYQKCKEWIATDGEKYHGAYPSDNPHKDANYLKTMHEQRAKYDSDEAFSKAYGLEFTGDMEDFMIRRSKKEQERCLAFIDEVIATFG